MEGGTMQQGSDARRDAIEETSRTRAGPTRQEDQGQNVPAMKRRRTSEEIEAENDSIRSIVERLSHVPRGKTPSVPVFLC
jgi:hypothetical protein